MFLSYSTCDHLNLYLTIYQSPLSLALSLSLPLYLSIYLSLSLTHTQYTHFLTLFPLPVFHLISLVRNQLTKLYLLEPLISPPPFVFLSIGSVGQLAECLPCERKVLSLNTWCFKPKTLKPPSKQPFYRPCINCSKFIPSCAFVLLHNTYQAKITQYSIPKFMITMYRWGDIL